MCIGQFFWGLQKPHRNFDPFGYVGLHIGPTRGHNADSNICMQWKKKKEHRLDIE